MDGVSVLYGKSLFDHKGVKHEECSFQSFIAIQKISQYLKYLSRLVNITLSSFVHGVG